MENKGNKKFLIALIVMVPLAVVLAIGTGILLTLTQNKDDGKSTPSSSSSASAPVYQPPSSSVPVASSSLPPVAPSVPSVPSLPESSSVSVPVTEAPQFLETPTVTVSGNTATVTFKTDISATVNTILSTRGDAISIAAFYDHFNRGGKLEGAVSKSAVYKVDQNGQTATFELPDLTKTYYLLVNAVDNENGIWQTKVTVITLHTGTGGQASSSSSSQSS